MKEYAVVLRREMVQAVLVGRKKPIRRLVVDAMCVGNFTASDLDLTRAWKDTGYDRPGAPWQFLKAYLSPETAARLGHEPDDIVERLRCRWGIGDRLWVKEQFAASRDEKDVAYAADPMFDHCRPGDLAWDWTPSVQMPRHLSRITLEVTGVRVKRRGAPSKPWTWYIDVQRVG